MVDLPLLVVFIGAAATLTITPGVDTAMVLRASTAAYLVWLGVKLLVRPRSAIEASGSIHVLLTLAWFAALIAATVPLGNALRRPKTVKTLDRLTGSVFVVFGIKLATSSAR